MPLQQHLISPFTAPLELPQWGPVELHADTAEFDLQTDMDAFRLLTMGFHSLQCSSYKQDYIKLTLSVVPRHLAGAFKFTRCVGVQSRCHSFQWAPSFDQQASLAVPTCMDLVQLPVGLLPTRHGPPVTNSGSRCETPSQTGQSGRCSSLDPGLSRRTI